MNEVNPVAAKRLPKRADRQRAISALVAAEGAVRIEHLAEQFDISLMTVHRDLDELEARGLLRKSRGVATALSSNLVESSDIYRAGQQMPEKRALAEAAMAYVEPGQAIFMDDSTTVLEMAGLMAAKAPLTIITNKLTLMNELRNSRGVSLVSLGGNYYDWCSAFMGRMTVEATRKLRADVFITSPSAVTENTCYNQSLETVDTKQAMFDASARRVLLVDHTKFQRRALHAVHRLTDFDVVIVDWLTPDADVARLRELDLELVIAQESVAQSQASSGRRRGGA